MHEPVRCVLCTCGNIDCTRINPTDAKTLGVSAHALKPLGVDDVLSFSQLHHKSIIVNNPDRIRNRRLANTVYEMKCTTCEEKFVFVRTGSRQWIVGFSEKLPIVEGPKRKCRELLNFSEFHLSFSQYVCRGMPRENSYIDFAALQREINHDDTEIQVDTSNVIGGEEDDMDYDVIFGGRGAMNHMIGSPNDTISMRMSNDDDGLDEDVNI